MRLDGIYYRDDARRPPFAVVRRAVEELDDRHGPEAVVDVGEWGPWMA